MKTLRSRSNAAVSLALLAILMLAMDATARVFVTTNSTWRYFKGASEASTPTNAWRGLDFDDSAWLIGAAPFHFGTNVMGGDEALVQGTILGDMRSNYTCVFLRQKFVLADTNDVRGLWLSIWYDDGVAIWINGQAAGSLLSVSGLAYTNVAISSREGSTRSAVAISNAVLFLRPGTNVLCLQAFNRSLTDDDFRIDIELTETPITSPMAHYFTGISRTADPLVTLSLNGSASNMFSLSGTISNQFLQLFDLYSIDRSADLVEWTRVAALMRTNNDPSPLLCCDTNTAGWDQCFYRTATNHCLTAFPNPSGPFVVGTVDRVMRDPARTNLYRYSPPTNAFMATFWYPADSAPAGAVPASMWDQQLAIDANAAVRFGFDTNWTCIFPKLSAHRFTGLPLATGGALPVILYSHGLLGSRKSQSQMAEELASHGYVVAAVDHPDCWATEFPDGRYLLGNHSGDVAGRLSDTQFLLDEIARLNDSDSIFAGRLDLARIGVYGISYGGTVVETCRTDARVKCATLWDAMNVQLSPSGLQKPLLVGLGQTNLFYSQDQWLFNKATNNAVFLQVSAAQHVTATDFAWTTQTPGERNSALAINACVLWSFDTYLKNEAHPFPTNPEIYNVQRK